MACVFHRKVMNQQRCCCLLELVCMVYMEMWIYQNPWFKVFQEQKDHCQRKSYFLSNSFQQVSSQPNSGACTFIIFQVVVFPVAADSYSIELHVAWLNYKTQFAFANLQAHMYRQLGQIMSYMLLHVWCVQSEHLNRV